MVYCVVPRELEAQLFERLTAYYADDPEVTVILDRREGARRRRGARDEVAAQQRELRDRRRRRAVGEFARLQGETARAG